MRFIRQKLLILLIGFPIFLNSQIDKEKSDFINDIYNEALSNGKSYEWLEYLSNDIGHRLSGSVNAERAIKWGEEELSNISDKVWLQPVMVPKLTKQ